MRSTFNLNGKNITYSLTGEGSPVVLLHGFGEDGTIWKNQLPALDQYQLLVTDLPGSGGSEMIADMSMEGLAEALNQLLGRLNIRKCVIIGHSMGGYITLAFAEKYPDKLEGFGLFHSTAYADPEEKIQARKKGIEFINRNGAYEFLKTSTPNLYSPGFKDSFPQLVEEHIEASRNFSDAALVSYYESMIRRPNRVNILKNSHVPVLFVLGKYDSAVPLKDGLEQCYLPQISYIHILDQSGHMGMIEEIEKTNSILSNYLISIYHLAR